MKAGFYPRIALTGVKQNKRLYLPYILTCVGMIMMYYIIAFLTENKLIATMHGGSTIQRMLEFGCYVMAIFAVIFLFYTHSFLIRRRKKEFGLYNILGMGKRNIARVLFWETLLVAALSLGAGLLLGIACSKFAELILVNVLNGEVKYTFMIGFGAIKKTVILFGCIFLLIFLNTLRQIRTANPVALLHSESTGEKPPKANWFFGIAGILLLGAAYYIAVSIKDPLSAMAWFFIAVIMVIIATYLIFIAGSVWICRILQKRKGYYYQKKHFVSVSSMAYRMKRNGAGLASICILATMVLVMITGSACLYVGTEDSLKTRYPQEIVTEIEDHKLYDMSDEEVAQMKAEVDEIVAEYGDTPQQPIEYRYASIAGALEKDQIELDVRMYSSFSMDTYDMLRQIYLVPLADYNRLTGKNEVLSDDEAMIYPFRCGYDYDTFTIKNGRTFRIVKTLDSFSINSGMSMDIIPSIVLVVPDFTDSLKKLTALADYNGDRMLHPYWYYGFDLSVEGEQQAEIAKRIYEHFRTISMEGTSDIYSYSIESREANRYDFYSTYGGVFFLGIMLSIVFLFATVLIVYYKQISEGYEDQARFDIMQKVGMTKENIRKSINSQMLLVFFLPLVTAVLHLAFAFPMIRKLLILFNLLNFKLLLGTAAASVFVFAVFYAIVYRITSNVYFSIVSGMKEE